MTTHPPASEYRPPEERLSLIEAWVDNHERICGQRYNDLRGDLKWIMGGIASVLVAVCGWALVQMHTQDQTRLATIERDAASQQAVAADIHAQRERP